MTKVWLKLILRAGGWSEPFTAFFETQRGVFLKGGQRPQFMFEVSLKGWGSLEANFGGKMS